MWGLVAAAAGTGSTGPVVFLGDSITAGGKWAEMFDDPSIVNKGVPNDTTLDILDRLEAITDLKPAKLFVMVGINDLGNRVPVPVIASRYGNILRRIVRVSPRTRLYIQSVLPVNGDDFRIRIQNREIMDLNQRLKDTAVRFGAVYIDLFARMATADHQLRRDYTFDGVHLTKPAYQVWRVALKPYVFEKE